MKEITATNLRKKIFSVLEESLHSIPTRVRYKDGYSIIVSYETYLNLNSKKGKTNFLGEKPVIGGKILGPLDENSENELLDYMGIK